MMFIIKIFSPILNDIWSINETHSKPLLTNIAMNNMG